MKCTTENTAATAASMPAATIGVAPMLDPAIVDISIPALFAAIIPLTPIAAAATADTAAPLNFLRSESTAARTAIAAAPSSRPDPRILPPSSAVMISPVAD